MSQESPKTISALYSLLGEFTVEFERICLFMRENIKFWTHSSNAKTSMIVKTLTTGMTAKPLLEAFRSIAMNVRELSEEEGILVSKICAEINSLIEARNDMLHSTWFAPESVDDQVQIDSIAGIKIKHTSKGIENRYLDLSAETFLPLIERCQKLHLILPIVGVVLEHSNFTSYFETLPNGSIAVKFADVTDSKT